LYVVIEDLWEFDIDAFGKEIIPERIMAIEFLQKGSPTFRHFKIGVILEGNKT
jgi:hypothetical protein